MSLSVPSLSGSDAPQYGDGALASAAFLRSWQSEDPIVQRISCDNSVQRNLQLSDCSFSSRSSSARVGTRGPIVEYPPTIADSALLFSGARAFYLNLFNDIKKVEKSFDFLLFMLRGDVADEFVRLS